MENFNNEQIKQINDLVFDENDDGTLDIILEYATDDFGNLSEVTLDFDGDGKADRKIYFQYDEQGRLSKKLKDTNLNGKINAIEIYNYDEDGGVTVEYDDNADGKTDYILTPDGKITDTRSNAQKIKETIKGLFPSRIRKKLK